jgi:hypothetical protein
LTCDERWAHYTSALNGALLCDPTDKNVCKETITAACGCEQLVANADSPAAVEAARAYADFVSAGCKRACPDAGGCPSVKAGFCTSQGGQGMPIYRCVY